MWLHLSSKWQHVCGLPCSDNLGATLDVDLLSYFAETDKSFVMEVSCLLRCCMLGLRHCRRAPVT